MCFAPRRAPLRRKTCWWTRPWALLNKTRATGYFKDAKRVEHFNQEADFAGVRDHPAFAKFAAELTKHAGGG
jgi:hypothetical protein